MPALDLFVLSSVSEALPNVLIEAQAAGVPVVSYDVGGVAETMDPGVSGLLVKEDTAEALAGAILFALDDFGWRVEASAQGRILVRKKFDIRTMVAKLSEILSAEAA